MKSKMLLFVAGLLLIGVGTMNAQMGDQTSIGPRVGVNFANVSNVAGSKSLTGLVLGLTSTYSISESTGLTIDLLYSGEGYVLDGNDHHLNYLQIPVLFDLFFGQLGEKFRPKVYAGLTPGFLLNAKVNDNDVDDFYNTFNIAVTGGLGFNYRVGSRIWLNTDLRGFLGLSDIRKDVIGDKVANNNVQVSIGLAYGLSKI
ncbi:MAG: PorT family protein [Saprospiraceae bacterium]|nr:PorT family protein [Candidatus Opimibacter iunctus]